MAVKMDEGIDSGDQMEATEVYPLKESTEVNDTDVVISEEAVDYLSKSSLIRTELAIGISFMALFSAFDAFSNLQSSLNASGGLGTSGLAIIYASMIITSLFVSTLTLSHFHAKWIIVVSMVTYIVYIATGYYPSWYTIIPASVVIGVGAAHLWLAVVIYVTDIATRYAAVTKTKPEDRVNLFLGLLFGFMYTSQIWGNLISSLVFQRDSDSDNSTTNSCGSVFCPRSTENSTVIEMPSEKQVYTFTSICIGLGVVGVGVLALFASAVKSSTRKPASILWTVKQVTRHILTSRDQQLLLLPSVFAGLWNGFAVGDFTMAYISCSYGIKNVGFVMITFGVGQSTCSVLFGKLSQYTGNFLIYVFGFITMAGVLITLLLWQPNEDTFYVAFILSLLIGLGVAVNNPVIIAFHSLYFKDSLETAQSSCRLFNSLGWAVAFGYSSVLCTNYKIYILLCVLVISFICITTLQYINRKSKRTEL